MYPTPTERDREHDHFRVMIEHLQRAGLSESHINAAIRDARGERRTARPSWLRTVRAHVPWL